MRVLYLSLLIIHVLSAVLLVGGRVFAVTLLMSAFRKSGLAPTAAFLAKLGRSARFYFWHLLGLLILTGLGLLHVRGTGLEALFGSAPFAHVFWTKMAILALSIVASALADFKLQPQLVRKMEAGAPTEETGVIMGKLNRLTRVNLILAILIVMMGVLLSKGI